MMQDRQAYDRARESLGNVVHLEHVNLDMPDQRLATAFHVTGLGLTRDPFLRTGLDNMWINIGRSQLHMPSREAVPHRLRGTIGLILPDIDRTLASLERVAPLLAGTRFTVAREDEGAIAVTCPFGNRYRCHGPSAAFGPMELGMPYVEFDVPPGTADRIATFYDTILGAPAGVEQRRGARSAAVLTGKGQHLHFREAPEPQPPFDGHHIAIYIADFAGPYRKLLERGLLTREVNPHEWRFRDIVDLATGEVLFTVEHEVRSMTHPLHGRPLVNRNTLQDDGPYRPGQDAFRGVC
jgi:hypothetical protein